MASPEQRSRLGKLAAETRWSGAADPALRAAYREQKLADYIAKMVAEAPPLTAEQRSRLAVLLLNGSAAA